jgi:hypothetical protein
MLRASGYLKEFSQCSGSTPYIFFSPHGILRPMEVMGWAFCTSRAVKLVDAQNERKALREKD